ncbi:MAG: cation-translocating P-type ATPase [Vicinamibacterales bacterium]
MTLPHNSRRESAPSIAVPSGLTGLDAALANRLLREHGPNRWVPPDRLGWLREALALLADPMAAMLVVAAAIYFALGETRDAVVLLIALVPVLGIDVVLEARSRAALTRLANAASPCADVVRDGAVRRIAAEHVVPGDLLLLQEGQAVAADGVTLTAANLAIDESSLTGEAEPQVKQAADDGNSSGSTSRFFAGSIVVAGHGFGRVTATGTSTQFGNIASLVGTTEPSQSPLQRHAAALVRTLSLVAMVVALGIIPAGHLRGQTWSESLLSAVSLAMAAIPEEFPVVLTLFLSVGAWHLASRGMLVRRLASVETLGSTTVICTDKTGTLTRGEFQMTELVVVDPMRSPRDLLEASVLACERNPADSLERVIHAYAERMGVAPHANGAGADLVKDYDFDPVGKHMSHVWRTQAGRFVIAAKGSVEGVLAHCVPDGDARQRALSANADLARRGLRVLAVAGKHVEHAGASRIADECNLTLYGLLGFEDALRPEVPTASRNASRPAFPVVMILGDHALTAHAVAEAAGILHQDNQLVTGDELASCDDDERARRIRDGAIFARITPAQKFQIVEALKRTGDIVAMTGDGVNDAPALRRADIGIAMGQRGTDVARATADLVLLDDNFASIVATVREGRHILQNIQRAFLYLIAFHVPIVVFAVLAPISGLPFLLMPIHLVWLELIVHPVSALVFQAEPPTASVMRQPPRHPDSPLLPRAAIVRSTGSGVALAVATFGVFWWHLGAGAPQARGLALVALLAGYQTLLFAERLALPQVVDRVPRSRLFWVVWSATGLSLLLILGVPSVSDLFRVQLPDSASAAAATAIGVVSVVWRLAVPGPTK